MSVTIRFADGFEITQDEIQSISPVLTHTGISDFRAILKGDRELESYAQTQERVHILSDGNVRFTGYITKCSHSRSRGTTTISGKGITKHLQENRPDYDGLGGPLTYSNTPVQDAIRDYWSRTDFTNASVYDQNPDPVATDELIQEITTNQDWQDQTNFNDDEPLVISGGNLELAQTTQFSEAENVSNFVGTVVTSTDVPGALSDNGGVSLEVENDFVELSFTPDYRIPANEFTADAYVTYENFDGTIETQVNGQTVNSSTLSGVTSENSLEGSPFVDIELDAGTTHTMRIELTNYNSGTYVVDTIQLYDTGDRYGGFGVDRSGTFDGGAYPAPQLYPENYEAELNSFGVSYNITELRFDGVFNDTQNDQRICLSNDDGTTYECASNTQDTTQDFPNSFGRLSRIKIRLSRYTVNSVTTPTSGDGGQLVAEYDLYADGNDLAIIDQLELSGSHFENQQNLHNAGGFQFVVTPAADPINQILIESFPRGQKTKTLPDEQEIDSTPEIAGDNYYNSIYLQGREVNGSRPSAETKDDDRIAQDGREISPGVLRDLDVSTKSGAVYRARTLLERATSNNALRGQKVYPARFDILPGYAYEVSFSKDNTTQEFTLEEISLQLGTDTAEVTLDFVPPQDLSEDISELRRNSRQQSSQL